MFYELEVSTFDFQMTINDFFFFISIKIVLKEVTVV